MKKNEIKYKDVTPLQKLKKNHFIIYQKSFYNIDQNCVH